MDIIWNHTICKSIYFWSQTFVEMASCLAVAHTIGFVRGFKTSDHVMTNFMTMWWVNLLPSGKLLHSLFASLLSFTHFLSRYNPRCVTEKSWTDAKSITWIRFASNLVLLRNSQQLCCKLWPSMLRNVCHRVTTCFESTAETDGSWNSLIKKPSQQTSWIITCLLSLWFDPLLEIIFVT